MKDLLDKLSSYNLFNYLLPGVIFAITASKLTRHHFVQEDIVTGVFFYYFLGLVISRIGSLTIEPFLKKTTFVKFAEYPDFIEASKKDNKIEILSEANNTYRTLSSCFVILLLLKIYEIIEIKFKFIEEWNNLLLLMLLLFLFLFSYRKQTNYIVERIRIDLNNSSNLNNNDD